MLNIGSVWDLWVRGPGFGFGVSRSSPEGDCQVFDDTSIAKFFGH